ncbi:TetR/AcrR family transcriptional regulator [Novosphingobium sp. G106]|uniref:TetR/AcrR family transcriptional regulator n=1 Tax=Novosphingobium sp. G106 TaxID=2849500 RepID=UPI001C2DC758|nr:TetR/AcrR family transcriptional regulator [Novosphingobium sp. G106]MBV1688876.1 TetR/AcrR family transcriptional regulator [Novosphingobium sp. G106]
MNKAIKVGEKGARSSDLKKSEITRQRLLDAAARVFATRGYAHTRLSDVAREANSHAGGIYYYFASREELVSEVLDISTIKAIAALEAALDSLPPDAGVRERLLTAATTLLEGIMANDLFNLAHNRIYSQVPDDVRARHSPLLRQYFNIWRQIIISGQKSGEIFDDVDPNILRLTIIGSIQWTSEWVNSSDSSAAVLAEKMMRIFFDATIAPVKTTVPPEKTARFKTRRGRVRKRP